MADAPTAAEGVISRYTVDATAGFRGASAGAKTGGGQKSPLSSALTGAILILLVILVIVAWRWMYRSKPNCGRYRGATRAACAQLTAACEGNPQSLNAVAHCMPVVAAASDGAKVSGWQLRACSRAIRNVSPGFVARQLAKGKACIPAEYAPAVHDERSYHEARAFAQAAAPLLPYALDVAHALPACAKA